MPGMHLYLSKSAERDLKLLRERWGVTRSQAVAISMRIAMSVAQEGDGE